MVRFLTLPKSGLSQKRLRRLKLISIHVFSLLQMWETRKSSQIKDNDSKANTSENCSVHFPHTVWLF
jgi:hypothetical protein